MKTRSPMRFEMHNLGGTGFKKCATYDVNDKGEYWSSVTDVPCPICGGTIRWAEAGLSPGYRICDQCGRCFVAKGITQKPTLIRDRRFDKRKTSQK